MYRNRFAGVGVFLAATVVSASACAGSDIRTMGPEHGVFEAVYPSQSASSHVFEVLADGGRIRVHSDVDDPAAVDENRRHLREIGDAFASGDSSRAFMHMQHPGAAVMTARKDQIEYVYQDLPRGAELRLVTTDPEAIRAIHRFPDYGTRDHGTAGHGPRGHEAHDLESDTP